MFIPYEKFGKIINLFIKNKTIEDFFYNKKISQNVSYINKNKQKVINRLQRKYRNGEKINVVFYLYDETKWKCQSLYDLLKKDERFDVKILVTRNSAKNVDNPSYQTIAEVETNYKKMLNKGLDVELAYDLTNDKHIPFKKFAPDIIIYQHPWYVETSQGPVACSKFALTYYVPYFFPNSSSEIEYNLRFHQYIQKYCVFNELTKNLYQKKSLNNSKNIIVTGFPFLDYFKNNLIKEKKYIIYAPHWTVGNQGISYSTFEWSGKFLLEYAKQHKEYQWVFKPHPLLKKALIDKKIMTKNEAENYYNTWADIGLKHEKGEYLDLFNQSKMLITDCGSFLGEYFFTGQPVIHLISQNATPYNETINQIIKHYYRANDLIELGKLLSELPQNDTMKTARINALENYTKFSAAENILEDIEKTIRNG